MDKKELRQLMRARKREHTPQQLNQLSTIATTSLHDIIRKEENPHTILLYHSLPDEVNTVHLICQLHKEGYTILLPTVIGSDLELHVYTGEAHLQTSDSFGISESTGPIFTDYSNIDLAVIPGMAFTSDGKRLGRGKGYYDRLLPHIRCKKIGLAFPFQIVSDIPCESHDIMMDMVVY